MGEDTVVGHAHTVGGHDDDLTALWAARSRTVDWFSRPTQVRQDGPAGTWFPDGVLNTCFNALDRHVIRGRADEPALVVHSVPSGARRTYDYAELLERVALLGGALRELGVRPGDRVLVALPPVPEAVFALLACARIGAVHVALPGDSSPEALTASLEAARPRVVLSASSGLESGSVVPLHPRLETALARSAHQPEWCVVLQRAEGRAELQAGRDLDLAALMRPGQFEPASCAELSAGASLWELPGEPGRPGPAARHQAGHAVALAAGVLPGVGPGTVVLSVAPLAGPLGPTGVVLAPLLAAATSVLLEGEPDAATLGRVLSEHRVEVLLTTAPSLREVRAADPGAALLARHDLSSLRQVVLAGGRPDPETARWASERLGVPVLDHWWPAVAAGPLAAVAPEDPTGPVTLLPGRRVTALDADGRTLAPGEEGVLALLPPLPPDVLVGPPPAGLAGWPTGDRGRVEADGRVTLSGPAPG